MIFASLRYAAFRCSRVCGWRRSPPQLHHFVRHLPVAGSLSEDIASATAPAYIMADPAGSCPAAFGLPPDSTAGHMAEVAQIQKYKYTSILQAAAAGDRKYKAQLLVTRWRSSLPV